MDNGFGWDGIGEAKVIGGSHAIDQYPDLIAARDGINNRLRIGGAVLRYEAIEAQLVVEAAIDAAESSLFDETL